MASGLNKVMLIGNLGRNPKLVGTANDHSFAFFTMATSEKWTTGSGEKRNAVEWHDVIAWDSLGNTVITYLKKGDAVYVEGKLKRSSWTTTNGETRYKTYIVAHQIKFLSHVNKENNYKDETETEVSPESVKEEKEKITKIENIFSSPIW